MKCVPVIVSNSRNPTSSSQTVFCGYDNVPENARKILNLTDDVAGLEPSAVTKHDCVAFPPLVTVGYAAFRQRQILYVYQNLDNLYLPTSPL